MVIHQRSSWPRPFQLGCDPTPKVVCAYVCVCVDERNVSRHWLESLLLWIYIDLLKMWPLLLHTPSHTHTQITLYSFHTVSFIVYVCVPIYMKLYSRHCSGAWFTHSDRWSCWSRLSRGRIAWGEPMRPAWGIGGYDAQLAADGWQPHVSAEAEHQRPSKVFPGCVVKDSKWHLTITCCLLLTTTFLATCSSTALFCCVITEDYIFHSLLLWRFPYCDLIWLLWHFLLLCKQLHSHKL